MRRKLGDADPALMGNAIFPCNPVMAGLVPAIHVFDILEDESWMPAPSAGMTVR
jgi:hypothetical protein